jgi:hypothetical protein
MKNHQSNDSILIGVSVLLLAAAYGINPLALKKGRKINKLKLVPILYTLAIFINGAFAITGRYSKSSIYYLFETSELFYKT